MIHAAHISLSERSITLRGTTYVSAREAMPKWYPTKLEAQASALKLSLSAKALFTRRNFPFRKSRANRSGARFAHAIRGRNFFVLNRSRNKMSFEPLECEADIVLPFMSAIFSP